MDDLISRKQAIDACMKYNGYGSVWACIMGDIKQLPSVTIKDTADKIKVTNCNDNISRQAICDALDKVFADRIKSAGFDSYETADRDTQLVCDGIMKAIDVVLYQPTVDHLAEVSKKGDLINRQDAIDAIEHHKIAVLGERDYDDGIACGYATAHRHIANVVRMLPSAQPNASENTCEIERKSNDCISRQDAIDACIRVREYHAYDEIEEIKALPIKALPSAQPEIIRCKDCKHWERTWANSWSPNYHYCSMIDRNCPSGFYCADAERRDDE